MEYSTLFDKRGMWINTFVLTIPHFLLQVILRTMCIVDTDIDGPSGNFFYRLQTKVNENVYPSIQKLINNS